MSVNSVPEKIVNYNVYNELERLVGISGEITLPTLEAMTETISGAGIAGEYESVTPGHFGSMEIEIPFKTIFDKAFSFMKNGISTVVLRASQQSKDVAAGQLLHRLLKITIKGNGKNLNLGKMAVGQPTESANTLEVLYVKVESEGIVLLELDKLNFIFVVNGEDQLALIRSQI